MRLKTFVAMLIVAVLIVAALLALRGGGHQMLAKWLPAIHGR